MAIQNSVVTRTSTIIRRTGVLEIGITVGAYFIYSIVRTLGANQEVEAKQRALDLVELERKLGFFWEVQMQSWILGNETVIKVFNAIYTYGHFPLIYAIGIWLFLWHRGRYVLFRNAFLISGGIGLVSFLLLPTAPPRLLPGVDRMADTLRMFSPINYQESGAFVNNYAAMPSLHIAWNLLLAIGIFTTVKNPIVRGLACCMPVIMSVTVIVTGNHYILDIVAGVVVALVAYWLALQVEKHGWFFIGRWFRRDAEDAQAAA
jgi:membrane-associated phospholipid phosphatase